MVRPARHLGARCRAEDPGRGRRGADVPPGQPAARPGRRRPGARRRPGEGGPRCGVGRPRHVAAGGGPARGPAVTRAREPPGCPPAARAGDRRRSLPAVRRPAAGALQQLVRALPAVRGRDLRRVDRDGGRRHLPHGRRTARRRGGDGLRRGLPATDPPDRRGQPQGTQQHPRPRPHRPGLTLGDRQQGRRPRRDPPRPRHARRLRCVRGEGRRGRARGRTRPGPAVRPRPPLGDQPPRVVHDAGRRHHRLRREPAEEVPGHLPAELRQRPTGHLPGGAPRRAALDVPRRADLPGRQPPHQAGGVLGVAAAGDPPYRPRRDLPRRGVHAAGDDADPRARSASSRATPTSPGAPPSGRSRTTSARCRRRRTT